MLETKYGLKYSMPHTLVHIVDNSMYQGELPTVVADDPSLYTSIVVTGTPMGLDNEIITVDRSDVLNVAYGMNDLTSSDINKYGQSVTYPASLLSQGVPIKLLRVTPPESTYAFSCLLVQWKWDPTDNKMHVRFKTSDKLGNDGLPIGYNLSSFKNVNRLNAALVKGFKEDAVDDNDGTGVWKQRVFMTFISAGRGKAYNKYNYAINLTQSGRRPANVRYLFSTIDTETDKVIERFYASLINENNTTRIDAIDNVNVTVGKRVKGSSVLVPTVNEAAVHELYNEYYTKMTEMLETSVIPSGESEKWIKEVRTTLNANTFDMIYGRYLYNGDSDVLLPYYQVDMFDLDIPRLDKSNRLYAFLEKDESINNYINDPIVLNETLESKLVGINENELSSYYVGQMFLTDSSTRNLSLITSINQYNGSVTSIPITQAYNIEVNGETIKKTAQGFRGYVYVQNSDKNSIFTAIANDLISKSKMIPVVDKSISTSTDIRYKPDFVIVECADISNSSLGLHTFKIAKVVYQPSASKTASIVIDVANSVVYSTRSEIYPILVFPTTAVTNLATELPTELKGDTTSLSASDIQKYLSNSNSGKFWVTPGSTIIDIASSINDSDDNVHVYVNAFDISPLNLKSTENRMMVPETTNPFVVGKCPTAVNVNKDVIGDSYDVIIYKQTQESESEPAPINYFITGGTPIASGDLSGYDEGDVIRFEPSYGSDDPDSYYVDFKIDTINGNNVIMNILSNTDQQGSSKKIKPGTYKTYNATKRIAPSGTEIPWSYIESTEPSDDFYASPIKNYKPDAPSTPTDADLDPYKPYSVYVRNNGSSDVERAENESFYAYEAAETETAYLLIDRNSAPTDWGTAGIFYTKNADEYEVVTFEGSDDNLTPAYTANTYYIKQYIYTLTTEEPASFDPTAYYVKDDTYADKYKAGEVGDTWEENKYYSKSTDPLEIPSDTTAVLCVKDSNDTREGYVLVAMSGGTTTNPYAIKTTDGNVDVTSSTVYTRTSKNWRHKTYEDNGNLSIFVSTDNILINVATDKLPDYIQRYIVTGTQGSIYRYGADSTTIVPVNYYSDSYGLNPNSELGGISVHSGYAGFLDDNVSDIEFKWKYSELLVRAFKGEIDARILSPVRCPAKYLFDGGTNTIVGQTILPYMSYKVTDIINASTIYTDDEKEAILLDSSLIRGLPDIGKTGYVDIDVKQAMYDLMEYRCYQGIPEDKRPIGPGSGLSLHLDSGITEGNTAIMVNNSFTKRFNNPNASWDIGGFTSAIDGVTYTYTKHIVDNLFRHMKQYSVNKPYTGKYSNLIKDDYVSFFPDLDTKDWEMRELLYKSGGNSWIMDVNGNLQRMSQRTLYREGDTSDLIQENNMRTLSQLVYILQNKIDTYLLEYNDDGVLKTLKDDVDNLFSNWVGSLVEALDIQFERDTNPLDGGDIVVCYVNVTFRGLILRVPIIVNVQRRVS